jgi:lipoate-protein ligase A
MRLLIHTAPTPAEDLALEEAIHTAVEEQRSPNTWRVWQAATPAVILGTGQEAAKEADLEACRAENVPVLRRHSGGGAVVIGPGAINFSATLLIAEFPGAETIRGAMSVALRPVVALLADWKLEACEAGLSDLALRAAGGTLRKVAGNAQARKKISVVVHGTLLADPDWPRLGRLLRFPSSIPDYRAGRSHRDFLTSLRENAAPHDRDSFTEGLRRRLPSDILVEDQPGAEEKTRAGRLLEEKYASPEWNFRR